MDIERLDTEQMIAALKVILCLREAWSPLPEPNEDEERLRRLYREETDTLSDLRSLYEHACEEVEDRGGRDLFDPLRQGINDDRLRPYLKWKQRRDVLREMIQERMGDAPKRPTPEYERRLRATIRVFAPGKPVVETFKDAAAEPEVEVGPSRLRKQLGDAMKQRHGYEGNLNSGSLESLLKQESDHWGINPAKVERVENRDST